MGVVACGKCLEETGLDGRCSVSLEGFVSCICAARVRAGEEVCFVFPFMVTARTAAVLPLVPVFHHGTNCKESVDMFRHPESKTRGELAGGGFLG